MQPKWVQIAEHTRIYEFPASVRDTTDTGSNSVFVGRELVNYTSERVSLLIKIISPFQSLRQTQEEKETKKRNCFFTFVKKEFAKL